MCNLLVRELNRIDRLVDMSEQPLTGSRSGVDERRLRVATKTFTGSDYGYLGGRSVEIELLTTARWLARVHLG